MSEVFPVSFQYENLPLVILWIDCFRMLMDECLFLDLDTFDILITHYLKINDI